jgi:hypothetical protein
VKKQGLGRMLVTKPDGSAVQREIRIVYDDRGGGLFEVEILGDSPLEGYKFAVLQGELKKVRDTGSVTA